MDAAKYFHLRIDNEDREQAPEAPWTAVILHDYRDGTEEIDASGTGETPAEALLDLALEWRRQERVESARGSREPVR